CRRRERHAEVALLTWPCCGVRPGDRGHLAADAPGRQTEAKPPPERSTLTMMQWQLFGDLPPEEVRRVLSMARTRTFGRGAALFHEGDPADSVHLIAKGRFAVRVTTPLGETATL